MSSPGATLPTLVSSSRRSRAICEPMLPMLVFSIAAMSLYGAVTLRRCAWASSLARCWRRRWILRSSWRALLAQALGRHAGRRQRGEIVADALHPALVELDPGLHGVERVLHALQPGLALAHGRPQAVDAVEHLGDLAARHLRQVAHLGGLELVVLDVQQLHHHGFRR